MDKHTFLTEYNISEEALLAADVSREELALIEEAYRKLEGTMRELGKSFIDEYLYDIEKSFILTAIRQRMLSILWKKWFERKRKTRKSLENQIIPTSINL